MNYKSEFNRWYSSLTNKTFQFGSRESLAFVKSAIGIFSQIVDRKNRVAPQIILTPEIQTAGVDIKLNKMYLPLCHITERQKADVDIYQVLLSYNGQVMHESAHLLYTVDDIEALDELVEGFDHTKPLMNHVYQIVEDLYIDNQNLLRFPQFDFFTQARLDYFFSSKEILNIELPDGEIESLDDAKALMTAGTMLKNPDNRGVISNMLFQQLESMLLESLDIDEQLNRVEHALKVYRWLTENFGEEIIDEFENSMSKASGEGEDDEAFMMPADSEIVETGEMLGNENSESYKINEGEVKFEGDGSEDHPIFMIKATEEAISKVLLSYSNFKQVYQISTQWDDLVGLMQARSETQRYYGPQQQHGTRMRQLHRIATDQKIFSQPVTLQGLGPQEVIILCDLSGSMTSDNNYVKALQEAWGMAVALERGRHRVAVYGHTADVAVNPLSGIPVKKSNCMVLEFKSFDENTSVLKERVEIINHGVLRNNADGMAVRRVGAEFSEIRNKKTLIVISDGQPASTCYSHWNAANEDLQDAVAELRSKGIGVISISIVSDCVDDNDELYGSAFNFSCTDLNIVELMVEKIFLLR